MLQSHARLASQPASHLLLELSVAVILAADLLHSPVLDGHFHHCRVTMLSSKQQQVQPWVFGIGRVARLVLQKHVFHARGKEHQIPSLRCEHS